MMLTSMYRALADDTRRGIVKLLLGHNYCVSGIACALGISESAVSQHLKVLKKADLLSGEKRGYHMHYKVDREKLLALAREISALTDLDREECLWLQCACGCKKNKGSCPDRVKSFCRHTFSMAGKVKLKMAPVNRERT